VLLDDLLAGSGLGKADILEVWQPHAPRPVPPGGPLVTGVAIASGEVGPGALFACVQGARFDGHAFAADAMARGASALLCGRRLELDLPQVVVRSVRAALGPVSAAFWAHPSAALKLVGVTGTNGKTTTCALLAAIFQAEGWPSAVIGTLTGQRTTPEAPLLQQQLAQLLAQGTQAVAMEVSSHALAQRRVDGTEFAAAVFNNLSQDHLDYHGTMENYFEAKTLLFTREKARLAVVNRGDPWGARLVARLSGGPAPVVTFAPEDASSVELSRTGSSFNWKGTRLELNIGGRFNVTNAVAAATTAVELGATIGAVAEGLRSVSPVRGRFELVDEGQDFAVVVDFAHTPGALGEVLRAARELVPPFPAAFTDGRPPGQPSRPGRVIVVFGAGGERDRSKRPLMGKVASGSADVVVVTSDNPRSERPEEIIEEVLKDIGLREDLVVDVDRRKAIAAAIAMAHTSDVVVIAGKGHETGQDFGTRVEPFDDVQVAREILRGET